MLSRLTAQNSQGEYYLTDTVTLLERDGHRAEAVLAPDYRELIGINTLEQLGEAEALYHAMHGGAARRRPTAACSAACGGRRTTARTSCSRAGRTRCCCSTAIHTARVT